MSFLIRLRGLKMNHERYISGRDFVGRKLLENAVWPIKQTYFEKVIVLLFNWRY